MLTEALLVILIGVGVALLLRGIGGGSAPKPAPEQEPSDPRPTEWYADPLVERLYNIQSHVVSRPMPSTPDDLVRSHPFIALVEAFADPAVPRETSMRYVLGEDAVLSWAALVALARSEPDPAIEERLLGKFNDYHPWTRHFMLRVLEAWHPEDPQLAGRVLVHVAGPSWEAIRMVEVMEDFLRRRAAVAPLTLEGIERPEAFDLEILCSLVERMDPALAKPVLDSVGTRGLLGGPPVSPLEDKIGMFRPLADLGELTAPRGARADGLLAWPSADEKLESLVAALTGMPRRSVLVVGEPGVGKTALIRRAAARLSQDGWTLFEAGASQINAGMMFTGSLEGRVQEVIRQLRDEHMLWIVPDFPQLLWAGRHQQSPTGLLEMILPSIESGSVLMLAEARPASLERVLAEKPEVARHLEIARLEPPSPGESATMLEQWSAAAAERDGIHIPQDVRNEAAALARQYLVSELPPGGVLRLLGAALALARRQEAAPDGKPRPLTMNDLIGALAQLTGLPLDILDERCPLDLAAIRQRFESRVIGQPEAVGCLVDRLALLKAGVTDPNRPTGVFLFVGGSGTGKTELARTFAEYLFGSPERLLRLDMSEMQDASALERLFGDPRPLETKGNSLAEKVRRQPFSVVLLDEFDRAHPRIWDLFLQVFDAGRLTDHRGETADFRHTIIILTSNLGTLSGEVRLGLVRGSEVAGPTAIQRAVERAFRPELLNRFDQVVVFRPLTRDVMRQILRKELRDAFARRGLRRRSWAVELEESAIELLVDRGFSPTLGARPLKRALESLLLTPLAAAIVNRNAPAVNQFLFVRADGERLAVEFVDPDASVTGAPAAAAAAGTVDRVDVATILFEAHGSAEEVEVLRLALLEMQRRIGDPLWSSTKERLLLECAEPGFWERADRFERLGRAEYLDRIENVVESASSLLERLYGGSRGRSSYPREMVRRLAQQIYLVDAASGEALECGPRDAFVSVEATPGSGGPRQAGGFFARRLAAMYEAWARVRGMRVTPLPPPGESEEIHLLAIAGFAAYRLLAPEAGLHVLEHDELGKSPRRAMVRVRIEPQPVVPVRDGAAGLRRRAEEAFGAQGPPSTVIVRRYREGPAPLVRDLVRGWRTGRLERVLAGDFDVIPVKD